MLDRTGLAEMRRREDELRDAIDEARRIGEAMRVLVTELRATVERLELENTTLRAMRWVHTGAPTDAPVEPL